MKTIKYHPLLVITNISALPAGLGCKYLEVIRDDERGVLIAARWLRDKKNAKPGRDVVRFPGGAR